ncbi:MAG TPA: response regulator transcription factor [bacterium]|nr:response regulator transcription factor [bacterium]HNM15551.1 response regulator transcription factor [bacterium]
MRILIADDSALVYERLSSLIHESHKNLELVGHAETATDAISQALMKKPDVVILDIKMPGGNGIEVLKKLKSEPKPPMIIMFTQYPYPQFRDRCLQYGADYFFDKTSEFDRIGDVLEKIAMN